MYVAVWAGPYCTERQVAVDEGFQYSSCQHIRAIVVCQVTHCTLTSLPTHWVLMLNEIRLWDLTLTLFTDSTTLTGTYPPPVCVLLMRNVKTKFTGPQLKGFAVNCRLKCACILNPLSKIIKRRILISTRYIQHLKVIMSIKNSVHWLK